MLRLILVIVLSAVSIECAAIKSQKIKEVVACEWKTLNIGCRSGELIQIKSAQYGRTNDITCPHTTTMGRHCVASTSLAVVNEKCNNKNQCTVSATNNVFGDPCFGIVKYLSVQYECIPEIKEAIACEWNTLNIGCETGETIQIKSANYGRTNDITCPHTSTMGQNCAASNSLTVVNEKCNNKKKCSVSATNDVFGDPCSGILKYLVVKYQCIPEFKEAIACEWDTLNIGCETGEIILIKGAKYGRTNDITCPHTTTMGQNCVASNSLAVLNQKCNNKNQCTVSATNDVFGDPCFGIVKYLSVKYECIPAPPCKSNEMQCNDGRCLPDSVVMDGIKDCAYGEDEINSDFKTDYACEGNTIYINCKRDEEISIINANYGRLSPKICTHTSMQDQHCKAPSSLGVVIDRCDKKRSCSIPSTNIMFGDPCFGTHKYTEVHYQCMKVHTFAKSNQFNYNGTWDCYGEKSVQVKGYLTDYACEHSTLQIKCKANEYIKIIDANYGRQLPHICTYQANTNCISPTSKRIVEERCNGKGSCNIDATNNEFGDPCLGTIKYLSVNFECVNSFDNTIPEIQ